jgi:hypothetical protein
MLTGLEAIAACGVAALAAPRSTTAAHFAAVRFHTVTSKPASIKAPAMADPMAPRPITVTSLTELDSLAAAELSGLQAATSEHKK